MCPIRPDCYEPALYGLTEESPLELADSFADDCLSSEEANEFCLKCEEFFRQLTKDCAE